MAVLYYGTSASFVAACLKVSYFARRQVQGLVFDPANHVRNFFGQENLVIGNKQQTDFWYHEMLRRLPVAN